MRRSQAAAAPLVLVLALALALALASAPPPALGQEPTTTVGPQDVPQDAAGEGAPGQDPLGDRPDGQGGSPQVFVVLSLLGGASAAAIMAVQWFRTRPPPGSTR